MSSVEKILGNRIPQPVFSIRPGIGAPLPSDIDGFFRLDVDNPDPTAYTLDPRSGLFEGRSENTPRIYGSAQGLLLETGGETNLIGNSESSSQLESGGGVFLSQNTNDSVRKKGESAEVERVSSEEGYVYFIIGGRPDNTQHTITRWFKKLDTNNDEEINLNWGGSHDGNRKTATVNIVTGEIVTENTVSGEYVAARRLFNGWVETVISTTTRNNSNDNNIIPEFNMGSTGQKLLLVSQLQESSTHASYIHSSGGPTTRGGDTLRLFRDGQPTWWPSELTVLVEIVPQFYKHTGLMDLLYSRSTKRFFWEPSPGGWQTRDEYGHKMTINIPFAPFKPVRLALSLTENEMRLAANGLTEVSNHDGSLLDVSRLVFGDGDPRAQTLLQNASFYPEAFPATPSDRSAGDPVSLETLTS